ncbi:MAG TPA: hypothetical protein VIM19_16605 [Actinomycetes bacterium]
MNPSLLLAHGVAVRADLPLPFSLVLNGSALALLLSFVALGSLWTQPRLRRREAGRPLPRALAGVLEASELAWGLRILGLVAARYVLVALFLGPDDAANPTAGALCILVLPRRWLRGGDAVRAPVGGGTPGATACSCCAARWTGWPTPWRGSGSPRATRSRGCWLTRSG